MYKYLTLIFVLIAIVSCNDKGGKSDAYGNFEATAITISSEANGQLLFLSIEEGQKINAGLLIAIVDTTQLDLQRKQLQASIGAIHDKLRDISADIDVLQNQKVNLIYERDRTKRLVEKKAATTKQLDDFNAKIDVAEKQIIALRARANISNRGILAEKRPLLAQVAVINDKIKNSYIKNPVNGTVLTKLAETHEIVRMGSPLYRIGQLDTMTLRFYVDAVQLQKLSTGVSVQVLIDDGVDKFTELQGVISWISDQAEFTPKIIQTKEDRVNLVYAVKAQVINTQGKIKIGMPAEINFFKKNKSEN